MKKVYCVTLSTLICVMFIFFAVFIFINKNFPLYYKDDILFYSQKYDLNSALVASLINEESSYNKDAVSSSGAIGLMQILPSTAQYICELKEEEYHFENLFVPQKNVDYGCFYLNYLFSKFESEQTVLCAYNAGETIVASWLRNTSYSKNGIDFDIVPYPSTDLYAKKILGGKKYYKRIL